MASITVIVYTVIVVTIAEVARSAGVSTATVSRYLAGERIRRATAVREAVERLDYRPSQTARTLRSGVTRAVGVVVPDNSNPFFAAVVKGIETASQQFDLNIYVSNTDENVDRERQVLADLVGRVDGVVLAPAKEAVDNTGPLRDAKIPVVLLDRSLQERDDLDAVLIDSFGGAEKAIRHLIALGHERIGVVSGPLDTTPGRERHEGVLAALTEAGIKPDPELLQLGDFKQSSGYQAALRLIGLTTPPTAIFAANNLMTVGVIQAANSMGVSVPSQLSIIGFDDFALADLLSPPMSVVDRPMAEQGVLAMRLLRHRIESGPREKAQRIVLETRLLLRGTCASPEVATR